DIYSNLFCYIFLIQPIQRKSSNLYELNVPPHTEARLSVDLVLRHLTACYLALSATGLAQLIINAYY
uniref:Uncharacterized protein n=1 Tax=Parascaris univalens TaxID=6257 RepID=A0A915AW76_PARUN